MMEDIWDGIKTAFRRNPYLWVLLAAIPLILWMIAEVGQ